MYLQLFSELSRKVEVGGKEIKCPFNIPLDSDLTYEMITYIEMPRILSEPRRGQFDRFIMPSTYIGTVPK